MLRRQSPTPSTILRLALSAALLAASGCTYGTVSDIDDGSPIVGAQVTFISAGSTHETLSETPTTDPTNSESFNYFISPYSISTSAVDWSNAVVGPWALAIAGADGYDREAFPAEHDWLNADICRIVHDYEWAERACLRRDFGLSPEDGAHTMPPDLIVRQSVMKGCSVSGVGNNAQLVAPFAVSNLGRGPLEILKAAGNPNGFQILRRRAGTSIAQFVGAWQNFGTVAPWFAVADDSVSVRLVDDTGAVLASSEQPLCSTDAAIAEASLLPGGLHELGGLQALADTFYGGDVSPFGDVDCGALETQGLSVAHSTGGVALLQLAGVADGDYTLEIGVNESGLFTERSLANNVASIDVTYAGGQITQGCDASAPDINSPGLF
ncbi:MAG: hypothetical protein ACRBN8_30155 [Nannocystales bacterium]